MGHLPGRKAWRCGRIKICMIWRYSVYFGGIGVLSMVAWECRDWWMRVASHWLEIREFKI